MLDTPRERSARYVIQTGLEAGVSLTSTAAIVLMRVGVTPLHVPPAMSPQASKPSQKIGSESVARYSNAPMSTASPTRRSNPVPR